MDFYGSSIYAHQSETTPQHKATTPSSLLFPFALLLFEVITFTKSSEWNPQNRHVNSRFHFKYEITSTCTSSFCLWGSEYERNPSAYGKPLSSLAGVNPPDPRTINAYGLSNYNLIYDFTSKQRSGFLNELHCSDGRWSVCECVVCR